MGELLRLDIAVLMLMFVTATGIHWAGAYCNRNRDQLLALFRPTLVIAMASTMLILALQSALLAGLVYYVPLELANMRLAGLLVTVGIGLVVGLCQIARHSWSAIRPPPLEVDAVLVDQIEQPALWKLAASVAESLGAPRPDNLLLGLEPEYFVTESRISADGVRADGYSLYLSVSARRVMTERELRAIIGHEFGHFRGADTAFSEGFYPLYNSAAKALAGMANAYGSWTLSPAIYMLHFFLVSFGKVCAALRRDREFKADSAGAEASSAFDLASALVKLEVFAPTISTLIQEHVYSDRSTTSLGSQIHSVWPPLRKDSLLRAETPHPFDSHPALSSRLEKLKIEIDAVLRKPVSGGADRFVEGPDALEARLIDRMRAQAEASSLSPRFTFVRGLRLAG